MSADFLTIHAFLATAESGSFSKAAFKVGRSQSAISQQIAKLEAELGKPLFERGKDVKLTSHGETFMPYARQILALHREAVDRLREPQLAGEVRFGLPEDFAALYLSDVLASFAFEHPRIKLSVECDLTLNLFNRFRKSELDLVLVKMSQPEDFPHGTEIWSEPLEWVGSGASLDEGPVPLVLSPQPCVYREAAIRALNANRQAYRLSLTSQSHAGKMAAVRAAMGITVLPRTMVPENAEILKSRKLPKLGDIHVSLLKKARASAATLSLEKFVLQQLKAL